MPDLLLISLALPSWLDVLVEVLTWWMESHSVTGIVLFYQRLCCNSRLQV